MWKFFLNFCDEGSARIKLLIINDCNLIWLITVGLINLYFHLDITKADSGYLKKMDAVQHLRN
jgi:hypothetical protein